MVSEQVKGKKIQLLSPPGYLNPILDYSAFFLFAI